MQKKTQVGGTHYLNTPFDANDLAYLLGASPGFRDIAKYISREKDNKIQDLEKALAYIEIDQKKMLADMTYFTVIRIDSLAAITQFANQFHEYRLINQILKSVYLLEYACAEDNMYILMHKYKKEIV